MVARLLADAAAVDPAAAQVITVGAVVALIAALAGFLKPIWTALGARISQPGQQHAAAQAFDQAAVDRAAAAARDSAKIEASISKLLEEVARPRVALATRADTSAPGISNQASARMSSGGRHSAGLECPRQDGIRSPP